MPAGWKTQTELCWRFRGKQGGTKATNPVFESAGKITGLGALPAPSHFPLLMVHVDEMDGI